MINKRIKDIKKYLKFLNLKLQSGKKLKLPLANSIFNTLEIYFGYNEAKDVFIDTFEWAPLR
ncbi:MAG: hypothetical protein ACE5KT_02755 [Methanosarcinales archaeon]